MDWCCRRLATTTQEMPDWCSERRARQRSFICVDSALGYDAVLNRARALLQKHGVEPS